MTINNNLDTHITSAEMSSSISSALETAFLAKFNTDTNTQIANRRENVRDHTVTARTLNKTSTEIANAKTAIDKENNGIAASAPGVTPAVTAYKGISGYLNDISNVIKGWSTTDRNSHINSSFEVIRALAEFKDNAYYYEDNGDMKVITAALRADGYEIPVASAANFSGFDAETKNHHYYGTTYSPLQYFLDDMLKSGYPSITTTNSNGSTGTISKPVSPLDSFDYYKGTVAGIYSYGTTTTELTISSTIHPEFKPRTNINSMSTASKRRILKAMKDIFQFVIEKSDIQNCYMKVQEPGYGSTEKIYHFNPLYGDHDNYRFQMHPATDESNYSAELKGNLKSYLENWGETVVTTTTDPNTGVVTSTSTIYGSYRSKPTNWQASANRAAYDYSNVSKFSNEEYLSKGAYNLFSSYREKMYLFFVPDKYKTSVSYFMRSWAMVHGKIFGGFVSYTGPSSNAKNGKSFLNSPGFSALPIEYNYSLDTNGTKKSGNTVVPTSVIKQYGNTGFFRMPKNLDYNTATGVYGTGDDTDLNKMLRALYRKKSITETYTLSTDNESTSDYIKTSIEELAPNHPARKRRELLFIAEFFGTYRSNDPGVSKVVPPTASTINNVTAYPSYKAPSLPYYYDIAPVEDVKYSKFRYLLKDEIFIDKFKTFFVGNTDKYGDYVDNSQMFLTDLDDLCYNTKLTEAGTPTSAQRARMTLRNAFKAFSQFVPYDDTPLDGIAPYKSFPSKDCVLGGIYSPYSFVCEKFINLDALPVNVDGGTPRVGAFGGGLYLNTLFKPDTSLATSINANFTLALKKYEYTNYVKVSLEAKLADALRPDYIINLETVSDVNYAGTTAYTHTLPFKVGNASPVPVSITLEYNTSEARGFTLTCPRNFSYVVGGKMDIPADYLPDTITLASFRKSYIKAFDYLNSLPVGQYKGGIELVEGSVIGGSYMSSLLANTTITNYTQANIYNGTDQFLENLRANAIQVGLTSSDILSPYFKNENYDIFRYFKVYFKAKLGESLLYLSNPYSLTTTSLSAGSRVYDITKQYLDSDVITVSHNAKTTVGNAGYDPAYESNFLAVINYNKTPAENLAETKTFLEGKFADKLVEISALTTVYEEIVNVGALNNGTFTYNGFTKRYIPFYELFYNIYVKPRVVSQKMVEFSSYVDTRNRYVIPNSTEFVARELDYYKNNLPSIATYPNLRTLLTSITTANNLDAVKGLLEELVVYRADETGNLKVEQLDVNELRSYIGASTEICAYLAVNTADGSAAFKAALINYIENYVDNTNNPLGLNRLKTYLDYIPDSIGFLLDEVLYKESYIHINRLTNATINRSEVVKNAFNIVNTYVPVRPADIPVDTATHLTDITTTNTNIRTNIIAAITAYETANVHYSLGLKDIFTANPDILCTLAKAKYIKNKVLNKEYINFREDTAEELKVLLRAFFGADINLYLNSYTINDYFQDYILALIFDNKNNTRILELTKLAEYTLQDYIAAITSILKESEIINTWNNRFITDVLNNNQVSDLLIYKKDSGDEFKDIIRLIRYNVERPIPNETFRPLYNNLLSIYKPFLLNTLNSFKSDIDKVTDYEVLKDFIKISELATQTLPVAGAVRVIDKLNYKVLDVTEAALKASYLNVVILDTLIASYEGKTINTIDKVNRCWRKIWNIYKKYKKDSDIGSNRPINELDLILSGIELNRVEKSLGLSSISRFEI